MITNNQFYFNNGKDAPVDPNALLLTWWTSLAVKPSNALMTALNTLSQGLFDDGNWAKLDLFGLLGGMETQEQQLRPLISTSGDDFVIVGTPILDANGVNNDLGGGYLNLLWNPVDNGTQYTLNSAFVSAYVQDNTAQINQIAIMGALEVANAQETTMFHAGGDETAGIINSENPSTYASITNTINSYYIACAISGGNWILYKNAVSSSTPITGTSPVLTPYDFYGAEVNFDNSSPIGYVSDAYIRHFMAGAGTANQTTIQSRLNTFYASRGL